jgi:hypothetical protein
MVKMIVHGKTIALKNGQRLSRDEFERRYEAMPDLKKAELIEGVVYMPSPVRQKQHGGPHFRLIGWMGAYHVHTPGVDGGVSSSIRLDMDNEPQPTACFSLSWSEAGMPLLMPTAILPVPRSWRRKCPPARPALT